MELHSNGYFSVYNTNLNAEFGPRTGITADGRCSGVVGQFLSLSSVINVPAQLSSTTTLPILTTTSTRSSTLL